MKRQFHSSLALTLVFILALALPILFTRFRGGDVSEQEKRTLAAFPRLVTEEGSLNRAVKKETENWLSDHIGFRSSLIRLASAIKYYGFRQSSSDQVHIGKDGWFYYVPNDNLEIATGKYPLSDETLAQILQIHLAIREELREKGIEYVVVMPTSKVSIYPEYLRYGSGELRRTPVDVVADYLEENSDLHVVRLKEVMLQGKEHGQVYYKTDTHWTYEGAYLGYREIVRRLNEWGLCDAAPVEPRFEDFAYTGEFGAMLGLELAPEQSRRWVIESDSVQEDIPCERNDAFRALLEEEKIYNPCHYYRNTASEGKKLLIFGDSMFGGFDLPALLAEHYAETSYIWTQTYRRSLVEEMQPDIVIFELTERFLNALPYFNSSFLP